jgi:hypothetical protein
LPAYVFRLDAPHTTRAVNECENENVIVRDLVDHTIRFHEELSYGFITEFWDGLTTFCKIREGDGGFKCFLNKRCGVKLRVARNVFGGAF